jgi:hypothetical protein
MVMSGPEHYGEALELLRDANCASSAEDAVAKRQDAQIHATLALMFAVLHAGRLSDEHMKEWARGGVDL